jgi:hypothetical protein
MDYTGISETQFTSMNVYPNPTNGELYLVVPEGMIGESAILTDISGKKIATILLNDALSKFDLSAFSNGIYFIAMEEKGAAAIRVVKE